MRGALQALCETALSRQFVGKRLVMDKAAFARPAGGSLINPQGLRVPPFQTGLFSTDEQMLVCEGHGATLGQPLQRFNIRRDFGADFGLPLGRSRAVNCRQREQGIDPVIYALDVATRGPQQRFGVCSVFERRLGVTQQEVLLDLDNPMEADGYDITTLQLSCLDGGLINDCRLTCVSTKLLNEGLDATDDVAHMAKLHSFGELQNLYGL